MKKKETKVCCHCKIEKPRSEFNFRSNKKFVKEDGTVSKYEVLRSECKACGYEYSHKYLTENQSKRLLYNSRNRAGKIGIDFNLVEDDIVIPETCPLLGVKLERNTGKKTASDFSPSLDRIDSSKGYVKGNVWVISYRANKIKNNASLEELKLLVTNLENKIKEL